MKLNTVLQEFDRIEAVEEDKELSKFYYTKLEEYDITTPDELEDISEFFQDLSDEWIEELDMDDMLDIYEDVCETYDDPKMINFHFLKNFITEKIVKKIRNGKIVRKKAPKKGYKVIDGKYVKIKAKEKRLRSKGAKRGARKKKGKLASIARKTKRSMKKRKNFS